MSSHAHDTYIAGYDGSPASRSAVEFARDLAAREGARVIAATVHPVPLYPYLGFYTPGSRVLAGHLFADEARQAAEQTLAGLPDDIERAPLAGGSVAHALHDLAVGERAALVAVGATHRGALGRLVPGSVAEHLLHGSPCPVAVVPAGRRAQRIRTIAVAYDGRPEATAALTTARRLAEDLGAGLLLLASVAPPAPGITVPGTEEELDELLGAHMRHALDAAAHSVPAKIAVKTRLLGGGAGHAIAEACAEAGVDLLVSGSRGYGPLRSVLLGGVSRHLVDHAPCPVIIVPRGSVPVGADRVLEAAARGG